ncbi:MAG: AzlC family ABC transporter permease [Chloroflexales bacterium]|nr:AzlC family ABC transporter permease [Chloroflexales bacterium]
MASELSQSEQVMTSVRQDDFRAGFMATLPLWPGAVSFGILYAVTALAAGLSPAQTLAMSLLVFAGAAQFAAIGLFAGGVEPVSVLITTVIINVRYLLLSASLAPYLRHAPAWLKALIAFQMSDESYALAIQRFLEGAGSRAYNVGANLGLYVIWQVSSLAGILLGAAIPDPSAYGLDLIFPLAFIGLLMPLLRNRTNLLVALLAGVLAVAGALLLPGSWYILIAGLGASGLGMFLAGKR